MSKLKDIISSIEEDDQSPENELEILADSKEQALAIAAKELRIDISMLDYKIQQKGTQGFLGFGRQPYRVIVWPARVDATITGLDQIEKKLVKYTDGDLVMENLSRDADGTFTIRVTKTGVWFTVLSPKGSGRPVDLNEVNNKLFALKINNANQKKIDKEIRRPSEKAVKIGEWIPNPEYDGNLSVKIADDEMSATIHFVPPRFHGRHMDVDDVVQSLKHAGIMVGIQEEAIRDYLEKMDYNKPLVAAKGDPARHGRDAYVDYKVKIDRSNVRFEEDEKGQVDYRDLDLLENVVVGQVLAVKVPAEEGIPGRTLYNKIIPARSGKDTQIKYGKNTILSEDGTELTAATNGQVVFKDNRVYVEEVLFIKGDVSLETGNITCLGSVVISGSVQDNFIVKAAGNIEIKGTVQKALVEAEGDIIVRQGITGRDDAKVESTSGSVFAKFIQHTNVIAEVDIVAAEGILHSNVDAGRRIFCNGRRARIVGGVIRAGEEVNARLIGADSFTKTEIRVGISPKVLQQVTDLESIKKTITDELTEVNKNVTTLTVLKNNSGGHLPKDKTELLQKLTEQKKKLTIRQNEVDLELEELKAYLNMLEQKGKVCAEKTVFPGVEIYIKDKRFPVKDPYNYIKFTLEGGDIRLSEYEAPEGFESKRKFGQRRK